MNLWLHDLKCVSKDVDVGFHSAELAYHAQIAHSSLPMAGREQKGIQHPLDQGGREKKKALTKH